MKKSQIVQGVIFIALLVIIFFGVHATIESSVVSGSSMVPTLKTGNLLVVMKAAYWFSEPARGDVVIISADWMGKELVKRVIGLPGDQFEIKDGKVYINGEPLDEPYINDAGVTGCDVEGCQELPCNLTIPAGQYFVMGDNRGDSDDSRCYGTVPRQDIIGRVCFRYWPLSAWHLFHSVSYSTS